MPPQARLKSLYSTHRKMQRKGIPVEAVYDARAMRIIIDDGHGQQLADAVEGCYSALPVVHRMWREVGTTWAPKPPPLLQAVPMHEALHRSVGLPALHRCSASRCFLCSWRRSCMRTLLARPSWRSAGGSQVRAARRCCGSVTIMWPTPLRLATRACTLQ